MGDLDGMGAWTRRLQVRCGVWYMGCSMVTPKSRGGHAVVYEQLEARPSPAPPFVFDGVCGGMHSPWGRMQRSAGHLGVQVSCEVVRGAAKHGLRLVGIECTP